MRLVAFVGSLLVFVPSALSAQNSLLDVQARVIEGEIPVWMQVGLRSPQVTIDWRQPPGFQGRYGVLRHDELISENTFLSTTFVATVDAEREEYIDTIEQAGAYYYGLFPLDEEDRAIPIFLRNRTISFSKVEITEEDIAAFNTVAVRDIAATVVNGQVFLTFTASRADRQLTVYRSEMPIISAIDLPDATQAGMLNSSEGIFVDIPIPEIDYYYAIIASELSDLGRKYIRLLPNENTTEHPVRVTADGRGLLPDVDSRLLRRDFPLPGIGIRNLFDRGVTVPLREVEPDLQPVAPEHAVDTTRQRLPLLEPVILQEERRGALTGSDLSVRIIVEQELPSGNWRRMLDLLANLLGTELPELVEQRVHFYRGQALYFMGDYRTALLEFLLIGDSYADETEPWINDTILRLSS